MIRSTSSKRVRTPSYVLHGRTCAYMSSAFRSPTLTERKPPPTGVVIGPLSATPLRRTESSVGSGRGVAPAGAAGVAWRPGERVPAVGVHPVCPGLRDVPLERDAGGLEHPPRRLGELGAGAVTRDQCHRMFHGAGL